MQSPSLYGCEDDVYKTLCMKEVLKNITFLPFPFFLPSRSENFLCALKLPSLPVLKTASILSYFDLFFLNYFLFQYLDSFPFNKDPLLLSNMIDSPPLSRKSH